MAIRLERGKRIQTEAFLSPSDAWYIEPQDAVSFTTQGLDVHHTVALTQTATSTFGFLRVHLKASLKGKDTVDLRVLTASETLSVQLTKDTVALYRNAERLNEFANQQTDITIQILFNDERIGAMVVGPRVQTLAQRLPVASFRAQAYEMRLATTFHHGSRVLIKEIVYETVEE